MLSPVGESLRTVVFQVCVVGQKPTFVLAPYEQMMFVGLLKRGNRMSTPERTVSLALHSPIPEPRPPDCLRMPLAIERSVWRQNIKFMHNRNQFSIEYFQFMKKLISCNAPYVNPPTGHDKLVSALFFSQRLLEERRNILYCAKNVKRCNYICEIHTMKLHMKPKQHTASLDLFDFLNLAKVFPELLLCYVYINF